MDTMPGNDPMDNQAPLSGLDPADLLRQGAAADTLLDGASTAFHPPTIEEIAAAFPQFEILELIGQGGMGAVYKVRQKDLDRIVALKILPPAIGQSPEFSERFTREARALAKLNHPGIVTIHEFGQRNGLFFILMEFVDGVNLAQLMKTGRVSPREALAIVPQVCDALQYAHDQGIVHRDIKPENLLLDRQGRVKVADFGIAKVVAAVRDPMAGGNAPAPENQTLAGNIIGTPQYMAPEQISHPCDVDHRADIYALGVVFYQMLTGELPGKDLQTPSRKVTIDVRLDEMVLRALEEKPERRYQTALEFRTALDGLPSATPSRPVPKRGMIRRWWWVFLVMIPLGLLLGFVAAGLVTYVMPKKFEAEATAEVVPASGNSITPTFFATQFETIKSRAALTAVSQELELPNKWMTDEETAVSILKGIIIVQNIRGTDLIRVRVRHTNPQDAAAIANAVTLNYQRSISGNIIIHERAMEPRFPASPNVGLVLFIGGLLGLVLSPLLALIAMMALQRIFPEKGSRAPAAKTSRTGRPLAIVCGVLAVTLFLPLTGVGILLLVRAAGYFIR
jgi:tRNA A-37 threonylcarbamoyl transferase component Bud32/capsular polysaccharide biosynthesis protein